MAITDLTGTKWILNKASADYVHKTLTGGTAWSSSVLPYSGRYYALNYTALPKRTLNNPHSYFWLKSSSAAYYHDQPVYFGYMNDTTSLDTISTTDLDYYPAIIEFDSVNAGSDKTSSSVIAWLEANATQIIEGSISVGNSSIAKIFVGSSEVSKMILNGATVYEKQAPAPTGHNLTINFVARNYEGEGKNYLCIKLNGQPSNEQDHEAYFETPMAGSPGFFYLNDEQVVDVDYTEGGTYTINNISSFTYWHEYENISYGDFIGVNSNSMPAPDWSNKVSVPLTQDMTIIVYYDYDT